MTTTLRPAAPERRTEDGGRTRPYAVCVNGRPVGSVRLATDPRLGPQVGTVTQLTVDEQDRHRGRGTVAALAAEEVLRGWGCTQAVAAVPAGATTALGLAGALGYRERGRRMRKDLSTGPDLPEGSVVRPMADAEYPAWHAAQAAHYVATWAERGLSEEQARAKAAADYAALLPDGPDTPGTLLRVLTHAGTDVGTLWIGLSGPGGDATDAYVYWVGVAEGLRGRGHGRTLMLAAEREVLAAGGRGLGLFVFAGNTPALRLYQSLGYRESEYHLFKPLL